MKTLMRGMMNTALICWAARMSLILDETTMDRYTDMTASSGAVTVKAISHSTSGTTGYPNIEKVTVSTSSAYMVNESQVMAIDGMTAARVLPIRISRVDTGVAS